MMLNAAVYGQELKISDIRRDFKVGHKDETTCKKHLEALEKHADSPIERGYEAAYHMFMAKHTSNPLKKMGYFKSGKNMLEKEIANNPENVELRYIRLCIQYYTPSFLGYKGHINEDKLYLRDNLYKLSDKHTKELLFQYLKGANMFSSADLNLLGR